MAKLITGEKLIAKHVARKDRILLVNPPVVDTRYSWVRWNQPLDLLKLGSHLQSKVRCQVELLDCMKPDAKGDVREEWLPRDRRYHHVKGERYPMRRYGEPASRLGELVRARLAEVKPALPTQVWITSLCSYWFDGIVDVCQEVRKTLADAQVVLLGQFPRLEPERAKGTTTADYLVTSTPDLDAVPWNFDLYGREKPPFVAVRLHRESAVTAVRAAVENQIYNVAFFEDDICREDGELLCDFVAQTQDLHRHLRYHVLCGLDPRRVTPKIAAVLAGKRFAALNFEQADVGGVLDVEAYRKAVRYLREAGAEDRDERLSGFVWIGKPREELEQIIANAFQVLETLGSLILKPYTPTPGSPEHLEHADYLSAVEPRNWSPHFFPFAELNGISREEYHDLYRLAAFLNEKVRNRSFNFFDSTLGAQLLRESLRKEVWKLEPSPLRLVD